jgi:hypothetical protein
MAVASDRVVVHEYNDLVNEDTAPRDRDTILRELRVGQAGGHDGSIVLHVPEWLLEEKDLSPVDGRTNVVAGRINYETEKAWLVAYDGAEAWLSKSVATEFVPARDADLSSPQQTLDALGGDA